MTTADPEGPAATSYLKNARVLALLHLERDFFDFAGEARVGADTNPKCHRV